MIHFVVLMILTISFACAQDKGISVDIFPGERLANDRSTFLSNVSVNNQARAYVKDELLQVSISAERDAHLYLLYHQADGHSVLIYPNRARRDSLVRAGTQIHVPGRGERFQFRVQAPFGTERLQVLASQSPVTELSSLITDSVNTPVVPVTTINAVADRLAGDTQTWSEHNITIQTMVRPDSTEDRSSATDSENRTAKRVGLFVGIGKYAHWEGQAAWPVNSAKRMQNAMISCGGLAQDGTRILLNEEATRENLQEAFIRWLPEITQPGDIVFIYLTASRYGIIDAPRSKEPDGKDDCFMPYDGTFGTSGIHVEEQEAARRSMIVDETLVRWLTALRNRKIVLILDRGSADGLLDETSRLRDIPQMDISFLASTRSGCANWHNKSAGGTSWFTKALTAVMQNSNSPLTIQQAYDRAAEKLAEHIGEDEIASAHSPAKQQNPLLRIHGDRSVLLTVVNNTTRKAAEQAQTTPPQVVDREVRTVPDSLNRLSP